MKIGITHNAYYSPALGGTDYVKMRSHGYSCADYQDLADTKNGFLYQTDDETFRRTLTEERKKANDAGVFFSQVHAPWPTDDLTVESRAVKLEYMKKAMRGCALLDGKYLVVHPVMPFGWGKDDDPAFTVECNRELFTELCTYGAEIGVGIAIENMPFVPYKLSHTEPLAAFVEEMNLPNFGICLDTGHANYLHEDVGAMVRVCGSRLAVLHVHDNNGRSDAHVAPFTGTIDWEGFRTAIREIGYQGCMSLETAVSRSFPEPLLEYMRIGLARTADYLAYNDNAFDGLQA